MNQNSRQYDSAFADEVLAEIARQRLTAKEVQQRAGITSSTWGNYFRERTTRIPLGVIFAVSDVLGVLPEEMMRRARVRAEELAPPVDPIDVELEAGLSPRARRGVAEARAQIERERAGREVAEDPPERSSERTRRSA